MKVIYDSQAVQGQAGVIQLDGANDSSSDDDEDANEDDEDEHDEDENADADEDQQVEEVGVPGLRPQASLKLILSFSFVGTTLFGR